MSELVRYRTKGNLPVEYMEILENFGFEPILFLAYLVNFLVILFVLRKFAYKPILKILEDRQHTIQEGYKQADEAKKLFEKAEEKEKEILKKAQSEAKKLIEEAKSQGALHLTESEEKTRKQVEKMIAEAREQIAQDSQKAKAQLNSQIVHLAETVLEKSLTGFFSQTEQETVLKNVEKKLKVSN